MTNFVNPLDAIYGEWSSEEVGKLTAKLDEAGIPYETSEHIGGVSIKIPDRATWNAEKDERRISVVSFNGSYGGSDGLLEIYAPGLNDGVEGFLTADEAFDYILDTRNGKPRGSIG